MGSGALHPRELGHYEVGGELVDLAASQPKPVKRGHFIRNLALAAAGLAAIGGGNAAFRTDLVQDFLYPKTVDVETGVRIPTPGKTLNDYRTAINAYIPSCEGLTPITNSQIKAIDRISDNEWSQLLDEQETGSKRTFLRRFGYNEGFAVRTKVNGHEETFYVFTEDPNSRIVREYQANGVTVYTARSTQIAMRPFQPRKR